MKAQTTEIRLKRTYDPASADDGYRILVDKLWPRGLSHENFHDDLWEKQLAPSDGLRHWFHEDPVGRKNEFVKRYEAELQKNPALEPFMEEVKSHPIVTLLFSSKDRHENNATVLRSVVLSSLGYK